MKKDEYPERKLLKTNNQGENYNTQCDSMKGVSEKLFYVSEIFINVIRVLIKRDLANYSPPLFLQWEGPERRRWILRNWKGNPLQTRSLYPQFPKIYETHLCFKPSPIILYCWIPTLHSKQETVSFILFCPLSFTHFLRLLISTLLCISIILQA